MTRNYSNIALDTTLTAAIDADDTTCVVASATGWPAVPFAAVLDPGSLTVEEVVQVTAKTGTTFTMTRGFDGTTAAAHDSGATVRHAAIAADFTDLQAADTGEAVARASAVSAEAASRTSGDATNASALTTHAALTTSAHGGIVASTDPRLTDTRTPTTHAASHTSASSDPLTLAQSQITGLAAALAGKADLAAANVFALGQTIQGHSAIGPNASIDNQGGVGFARLAVLNLAETETLGAAPGGFAEKYAQTSFQNYTIASAGAWNWDLYGTYTQLNVDAGSFGLDFAVGNLTEVNVTTNNDAFIVNGSNFVGNVAGSGLVERLTGVKATLLLSGSITTDRPPAAFEAQIFDDTPNANDLVAYSVRILSGNGTKYGLRTFNALDYAIYTNGGAHRFGDYLDITEISAPAAPSNTHGRLFCRDNAGKTELCVRFATGAIQVLSMEP